MAFPSPSASAGLARVVPCIAVRLHADDGFGVAAFLALQRHVPDEGCGSDPRWAKEQLPGNIGDPATARTGGANNASSLATVPRRWSGSSSTTRLPFGHHGQGKTREQGRGERVCRGRAHRVSRSRLTGPTRVAHTAENAMRTCGGLVVGLSFHLGDFCSLSIAAPTSSSRTWAYFVVVLHEFDVASFPQQPSCERMTKIMQSEVHHPGPLAEPSAGREAHPFRVLAGRQDIRAPRSACDSRSCIL